MHLSQGIDIQGGITGGIILGVSTSAFLLFSGRITGLSGIAENCLNSCGEGWNWSYMTGLIVSGVVLAQVKPDAFGSTETALVLTNSSIIAAGLLTGFGTRLSGGCTSGHGLCGLARRSPRSLVAVLSFMFSGAVTAYLTRSPDHLQSLVYSTTKNLPISENIVIQLLPTIILLAPSSFPKLSSMNFSMLHLTSFLSALLFGLGLGVSGMCNPEKVSSFLDFTNQVVGWNPTLMCVLGAGCAVTFSTFHYFVAVKQKVLLDSTKQLNNILKMGTVKENMKIDVNLILGSMIFGVGWGLAGMCPGPAVVSLGAYVTPTLIFIPSMLLGMKVKEWLI